jgi:hypothetical protein
MSREAQQELKEPSFNSTPKMELSSSLAPSFFFGNQTFLGAKKSLAVKTWPRFNSAPKAESS